LEINDKNTPADFPTNEFTQMIEEVARRNRMGGSLPPERGVAISATPLPSVRSADLGQPVPQPAQEASGPPAYTSEEMAELDRLALESGLVRGPVNARIAQRLEGGGIDDGPYGSLEEAIAAGAPIGADDDAIAVGAARFRDPSMQPLPPVRQPVGARGPVQNRQTAREFIASQPATQMPRLPDFKKVQMIDLINGKVYVDGLEFIVTKSELQMLRKFCVTTAKEQIQKALNEALAALDVEDSDGGAAEVQ
jgi:hypothetical protein